jgi:hypothetical protein
MLVEGEPAGAGRRVRRAVLRPGMAGQPGARRGRGRQRRRDPSAESTRTVRR